MNTVSRRGQDGRHHECQEATVTAGRISMSGEAAGRLVEVLQLCETFLTTPMVRAELADFCLPRPGVSSDWLIDILGWHTLHLRARIAEAGEEQS
jgi:hypothetical protein